MSSDEEKKEIARKQFDEYYSKCACPIQKYVAYFMNKPRRDLFDEKVEDCPSEFKDASGNTHKLKLDMVSRDYNLDLSRLNSKVVKDEISKIFHMTAYPIRAAVLASINIDALDLDERKKITNIVFTVDPHNSTIVVIDKNDRTWTEDRIKTDKFRLGIVWC
jgi:hypothetical protein